MMMMMMASLTLTVYFSCVFGQIYSMDTEIYPRPPPAFGYQLYLSQQLEWECKVREAAAPARRGSPFLTLADRILPRLRTLESDRISRENIAKVITPD
jgi:hypothetical protein